MNHTRLEGRKMHKERHPRRKAAITAIKWAVITLAGIFLFLWAKQAAGDWRGYDARGGEYLLLPLPLWWWLIEKCAGDFIRDIKAELFTQK